MAAAQQQMAAAALSPADAAARRGAGPHTPDLLDHSVDEEEDLGAEVEAQARFPLSCIFPLMFFGLMMWIARNRAQRAQ
jgi:hypothetical protein